MNKLLDTPPFWSPMTDLLPVESVRKLRNHELMAYSSLITVFRAQGQLTSEKKEMLTKLRKILRISPETHRAEIRRAVNDEQLASISNHLTGKLIDEDWVCEGKRIFSVPQRENLLPISAEFRIKEANVAVFKERFQKKILNAPNPSYDLLAYEKVLTSREASIRAIVNSYKAAQSTEKARLQEENHLSRKREYPNEELVVQSAVKQEDLITELNLSTESFQSSKRFAPSHPVEASQPVVLKLPEPQPAAVELVIDNKEPQIRLAPAIDRRLPFATSKVFPARTPLLTKSGTTTMPLTKAIPSNVLSSSPAPSVRPAEPVTRIPGLNSTSVIHRFTSQVSKQGTPVLAAQPQQLASTVTMKRNSIALKDGISGEMKEISHPPLQKSLMRSLTPQRSQQPSLALVHGSIEGSDMKENPQVLIKNSHNLPMLNHGSSQLAAPAVPTKSNSSNIQIINSKLYHNNSTPISSSTCSPQNFAHHNNNNNNNSSSSSSSTFRQMMEKREFAPKPQQRVQGLTIRPAPLSQQRFTSVVSSSVSTVDAPVPSSTPVIAAAGPCPASSASSNSSRSSTKSRGFKKSNGNMVTTISMQLPAEFNNQVIELPIANLNVDLDESDCEDYCINEPEMENNQSIVPSYATATASSHFNS